MTIHSPQLWLGILSIVTVGLMMILVVKWVIQWDAHRKYMRRIKEIDKQPLTDFDTLHNGWVVVRREALLPELHWSDTVGMVLPPPVAMMLCDLPGKALFEILVTLNYIDTHTQHKDDMRRGLTIGSALFKYSIPQSFVLLDRRTQLLTELFRVYDQDRKLARDWVKDESIFEANKALFSSIESGDLDITREDAIQFYYTYYGMVAPWVISSSEGKYFPHLSAFVDLMLRKAGLDHNNDALAHQMYITVVVIAELAELKIPLYWVMRTALADAVLQAAKGMEPQKPQLSLVPKN